MSTIKRALDPKGIMNPAKIFSSDAPDQRAEGSPVPELAEEEPLDESRQRTTPRPAGVPRSSRISIRCCARFSSRISPLAISPSI